MPIGKAANGDRLPYIEDTGPLSVDVRHRAYRTVVRNAVDNDDLNMLVDMLGLNDKKIPKPLKRAKIVKAGNYWNLLYLNTDLSKSSPTLEPLWEEAKLISDMSTKDYEEYLKTIERRFQ